MASSEKAVSQTAEPENTGGGPISGPISGSARIKPQNADGPIADAIAESLRALTPILPKLTEKMTEAFLSREDASAKYDLRALELDSDQTRRLTYGLFAVIAGVLLLSAILLWNGRDAVALEVIRMAIAAGGGAGVGFTVGYSKGRRSVEEEL